MNLEYAKNHLLLYAGLVKSDMLNKGNYFYLDLVDEMMVTLITPAAIGSISQLEMFYEFLVVFNYSVSQGNSERNANMLIENYRKIANKLKTDPSCIIINQIVIQTADLCVKNIEILCSLSIGRIDRMLKIHQTDEIQAKLLARKEILEKILKGLSESISLEQINELALILMATELDMDLLNHGELGEFFAINNELFLQVDAIFPSSIGERGDNLPQSIEEGDNNEDLDWCDWLCSLIWGHQIHPTDPDDNHALEIVANDNHLPAVNVSLDRGVASYGHHVVWEISDI